MSGFNFAPLTYGKDSQPLPPEVTVIAGEKTSDSSTQALQTADDGSLYVTLVGGGAGGSGTSMVDDAAFTVGTTAFTPAGGTYKSTRDSVDDNDGGAFAMTAKRGLYTTIETPAGDSAMDETNDSVKVTITADDVGIGGGTSYTEDVAAPTPPVGPTMMMIRDDALTTPAEEGDWMAAKGDANGAFWVSLATKLLASQDSIVAFGNTVKDGSGTNYVPLLDTDGHQQVDVLSVPTITANINTLGTMGSGQTNVTTAGTQVALASTTAIKSITIKAKHANTGFIYVGASSVDSSTGFVLDAGETVSMDFDDLADIYIDSSVNGEGVSYIYVV